MRHYLQRALFLWAALLVLAASPSWAFNGTPYGYFTLDKANNKSIDFLFTIHSDPGHANGFFYAQQFWFDNGTAGYLGLQQRGVDKRAIFSIWDTHASIGLMQGALAEPFSGEGDGQHVLAPFDWQVGHAYRFRLEHAGGADPWWEVSITNLKTSEHWRLGKIQTPAKYGLLQQQITTFTEVFTDWAPCDKVGYTRVTFGKPTSDNGQGKTVRTHAAVGNIADASCPLPHRPGAKVGVNMGVRADTLDGEVVHQVGLHHGPQTWGDHDRQGEIGKIFRHDTGHTRQPEYFRLIALNSDHRYSAFPQGGANNGNWVSLGNKEPYYNGPPASTWSELHQRGKRWGESDRKGVIGDIYRSEHPTVQGVHYFRLTRLGSDGRYWYFPEAGANNDFWTYVGSEGPRFDARPIPYTLDLKPGHVLAQTIEDGQTAYYRYTGYQGDRAVWPRPAGTRSDHVWTYIGINIAR